MTVETWILIGRIANIALSAVCLILLPWCVGGWKTRSAGNRFLWMGIAAVQLAIAFGALESILQDAIGGWRTVTYLVAQLYVLTGMILKISGRWRDDDSAECADRRPGTAASGESAAQRRARRRHRRIQEGL